MKLKSTPDYLIWYAVLVSMMYAILPVIRVLPDAVRALWRLVPELLMVAAVIVKKKRGLYINLFLTTVLGIFLRLSGALFIQTESLRVFISIF